MYTLNIFTVDVSRSRIENFDLDSDPVGAWFVSDFWFCLRSLSREEVGLLIRSSTSSEFVKDVLEGRFIFQAWQGGLVYWRGCFTDNIEVK